MLANSNMYDVVLIQIRMSSNTRNYCKLYVIISCALLGSLVIVTDTGATVNDANATVPETVLKVLDANESTVSTSMTGTNQTIQGETPLPYEKNISTNFPFESHYVEVLGSQMHYIDEGEGDPILFIHGNPTSSYLWRNIIPHVEPYGRAIAVDLIGMGRSDKPDIDYRFVDHAKYLQAFIEKLDLKNITLVIHDWGSALGFNYAMKNQDNIKGIAFMEAFLKPLTWDTFPQEAKDIFQKFRTPKVGYELIVNQNFFVEKAMPSAMIRNLTEEEMSHYREPFMTVESRKPVWVWPNEIPIDGKPADVYQIVTNYSKWLQRTEIPKLLIYVNPGGLIDPVMVKWSETTLKNLETVYVGQGIHYIQEDHPHAIGKALASWIQQHTDHRVSLDNMN
jgi:haloalkane dehalogenase